MGSAEDEERTETEMEGKGIKQGFWNGVQGKEISIGTIFSRKVVELFNKKINGFGCNHHYCG